MDPALNSLASTAKTILDAAQLSYNGGLPAYLLANADLRSVQITGISSHLLKVIFSKGYLMAIISSGLWIALLIAVIVVVIIVRKHIESSSLFMSIQTKIYSWLGHRKIYICMLVMLVICIVLAVIPFILNLKVQVDLQTFLGTPPADELLEDFPSEAAFFVRIRSAVRRLLAFIELLVPHARVATMPVLEETIEMSKNFSDGCSTKFQAKLMKSLGALEVFAHSGVLIDMLTAIFNSYEAFLTATTSYQNLTSYELLQNGWSFFNYHIGDVKKGVKRLVDSRCPETDCATQVPELREAQKILEMTSLSELLPASPNSAIKAFNKAASFLYSSMVRTGQTPDTMRKQLEVKLQMVKDKSRSMREKSAKLINATAIILQTAQAQWDDLEEKLEPVTAATKKFLSSNILKDANKWARMAVNIQVGVLLADMLLFLIFFIIFAVISTCKVFFNSSFGSKRIMKNVGLVLLPAIILNIIFALIIFLVSGYAHTEVCRYLTEKPSLAAVRYPQNFNSTLTIDRVVNDFISRNWNQVLNSIPKDPTTKSPPPPKPRDIFFGLQTVCRQNGSIMTAINAIESFDSTDKNETIDMLEKGRIIMLESVLENNKRESTRDLERLQNEAIPIGVTSVNCTAALLEIGTPLNFSNIRTVRNILEKLRSEDATKWPEHDRITLDDTMEELQNAIHVLSVIEQARLNTITQIKMLQNNQRIQYHVPKLLASINSVQAKNDNKTYMKTIANNLYDEIIFYPSLENSAKIAYNTAAGVYKVIGPCRHVYLAYTEVVTGVCGVTVGSFALMYITLFWAMFLVSFIVCSLILLLLLTRQTQHSRYGSCETRERGYMYPLKVFHFSQTDNDVLLHSDDS